MLCAGIDGAPETRTAQGNELHFQVNHLGHMLLTCELMPSLRSGGVPARVVSLTSSASLDAQAELLDDLAWRQHKFDKRQAYCVSKACNVLLTDFVARERDKSTSVLAAAVDPGPTVSQIVRYEMPQRAQQRAGMSRAQLERQARQLGFRTPTQAGGVVAQLVGATSQTRLVSGGFYLGIAAPPGQAGPLIQDPIPWRTPEQASRVWAASAQLIQSFASPEALLYR